MKRTVLSIFLLCLMVVSVLAQDQTIRGKVTGSDGLGLPGVTVTIPGKTTGTQTTAEGTYSITVPAGTKSLSFSYIGYSKVDAPISGSTVNVTLKEDINTLSEVIVTGYSTIDRRQYSGATDKIAGAEVSRPTFGSFDQALQGAAAGVTVIASGGQPGQNAVVRIRGNGSINGSNVPLYIVDGIEVSAADFQSMNQGDFDNL